MKVAACKYLVGEPRDFDAFAEKQAALLGEAKAGGAQVAVLPEYLALELAAMFDAGTPTLMPPDLVGGGEGEVFEDSEHARVGSSR